MWKGLGSALTTRGLLLAVEDCTSKFMPWPIRVDSSSSLRMVGQHLLLKGKLKLDSIIAKSRCTIPSLLCTNLILQPSVKPSWCHSSLPAWLVSLCLLHHNSVDIAEIFSQAFSQKFRESNGFTKEITK